MDDVSDIFKMYGVDYKDVCIKYVIEVIFKYQIFVKVHCCSLQSMVKDMDSYIDRCIGKDDFFKLATVNSVKNYPPFPNFTSLIG